MHLFNNSDSGPNDELNKQRMSSHHTPTNNLRKTKQIYNQLTDGIASNVWGYGMRRIKLTADPNVPEFVTRVPYTFTTFGFKNQAGEWFVCVRMNIDQHSPQKMRPMNPESDIYQLWGEMMLEFADEYARKHT